MMAGVRKRKGSLLGPRGIRGWKGDSVEAAQIVNDELMLEVKDHATGVTQLVNAGMARGPQGLPGLESVPTPEGIAQNLTLPGPAKDALDAAFAKRATAVSIREFGAVGDGVTDDTVAIQAALNSGGTFGQRRIVTVPRSAGAYIFRNLTIPSGVTLTGSGGVLKLKDGVAVNAAGSYYPINIPVGTADAGVVGCVIDGNGANNTTFTVCDVITAAGTNVRVEDNTILNAPDSGVMFSKATGSSCSRNRINGATDVGIYVNDGDGTSFRDNVIVGNVINGCTAGGIALKRITSKCIVSDNVIWDCGHGITLENASTATDFATDILISNNRVRNVGRGIELRGSEFCVVSGNRVDRATFAGIVVTGASSSAVVGNVVSGGGAATGVGILVQQHAAASGSSDLTVTGNVVDGVASHGVHLVGTASLLQERIAVASNTVTSAGGAGLRIDAHNRNVTIVGNVLGSAGANVEVYAGATYRAAGNILANGTSAGIWFQAGASEDGRTYVGAAADTYFSRVGPGIMETQHLRLTETLRVAKGPGFFGAVPPSARAANPGIATGTDASVINAVVAALRAVGLVA